MRWLAGVGWGEGVGGRRGRRRGMPRHAQVRRQQQRILHHSALIDYVLAAERQSGQTLTIGDALTELLADITEAARTIGTFLQTKNRS